MNIAILALLALLPAVGAGFAFRMEYASTSMVFWAIAIPYIVLAALGIYRMHKDGDLEEKLRPRSGDLAIATLIALLLYFGTMGGKYLLAPAGSPREQWLMRFYLQIGDPLTLKQHFLPISAGIAIIAALSEIAFRGLGYRIAEDKWGTRRAFPTIIGLYALAHLPTLFVLSVPGVGWNPLVFFTALGGGIVWTFLVASTGRLIVAIISHALFAWLVIMQFPLWKLG